MKVIKWELDKWQGRFSVERFATHIASVLGLEGLDRTTLYQYKDELGDRFEAARRRYREDKPKEAIKSEDVQWAEAQDTIRALRAERDALKREIERYRYRVIQMLYNAYYYKVEIARLDDDVLISDAEELLKIEKVQRDVKFFDNEMPPPDKR
jgi:predicted DsbA family dithiol-disulfide isomerase